MYYTTEKLMILPTLNDSFKIKLSEENKKLSFSYNLQSVNAQRPFYCK